MNEEKLLHLVQKKKGFFEAILDLTENEELLPFGEWVAVLEQKKILLDCIEEIDGEMDPFKAKLHDLSQEVSEELEKTQLVIQRILHVDKINQEKRKREVRGEENTL